MTKTLKFLQVRNLLFHSVQNQNKQKRRGAVSLSRDRNIDTVDNPSSTIITVNEYLKRRPCSCRVSLTISSSLFLLCCKPFVAVFEVVKSTSKRTIESSTIVHLHCEYFAITFISKINECDFSDFSSCSVSGHQS